MSTLTIRGCDDALARSIQAESDKRGISMNRLVLNVLGEKLVPGNGRKHYDDLDSLAGTWTEEDAAEFEHNTTDFNRIDPEDWK